MAAAASAASSSSSESVGPANSSSPPIVTDVALFRNAVTCSSTERVYKGGAANRGPTPAVLHHAVVASWNAIGMAQLHALQHVEVDAACSAGSSFSGDVYGRATVTVPLRRVLATATPSTSTSASSSTTVTRTTSSKLLDLYLCQCRILSGPAGDGDAPALPQLSNPACIPRNMFQEANVWYSPKATHTNLHYDANHNILVVSQGCKRVVLVAPRHTPAVAAHPLFSAAPNHSKLKWFEDPKRHRNELAAAGVPVLMATVSAGEALFIPEGWWHAVASDAGTLAVNFWFAGTRAQWLSKAAVGSSAPYMARSVLLDMLSQQCERDQEAAARLASQVLREELPSHVHAALQPCLMSSAPGARRCQELMSQPRCTMAQLVAVSLLASKPYGASVLPRKAKRQRTQLQPGTSKEITASALLTSAAQYSSQTIRMSLLRCMPMNPTLVVVLCQLCSAGMLTWHRIVAELDCVTAAVLAHRFEAADAAAHSDDGASGGYEAFYAVIFSAGEPKVDVRARLHTLVSQFRQRAWRRLCADFFGDECHSSSTTDSDSDSDSSTTSSEVSRASAPPSTTAIQSAATAGAGAGAGAGEETGAGAASDDHAPVVSSERYR